MPANPFSRKSTRPSIKKAARSFGAAIATDAVVPCNSPSDNVYVDEDHPTGPCVHADSRVLICGTFPPVRKSIHFYYPNANNDMWRILGEVFFSDRDHFYMDIEVVQASRGCRRGSSRAVRGLNEAEIRRFVPSHPIGFFDVCKRVRRHRGNSSDDNIEALVRTDVFHGVLAHTPHCEAIITTGTLALTMLLDALTGCGTFTSANGDAVAAVARSRLGKVKYNIPPVGGKLLWTPDARAPLQHNALWIYRAPSTSRALPMRREDKVAHYRTMIAAHLTLSMEGEAVCQP